MLSIKKVLFATALLVASSAVFAADTYIQQQYGQIGQVAVSNGDRSVFAEVSVSGAGVNQKAYLWYTVINFDAVNGYSWSFWRGDIPVDAVTVNGVASMSVALNTCEVYNVGGCGDVDFTVATEEPASGWIDTAAWGWSYGNVIYRSVGPRQVRDAASTGTVLGNDITSKTNSYISKVTEVTVSVIVGN